MAITIQQFQVGGFDDNLSYLIINNASAVAYIVDPAGDLQTLYDYLDSHNLQVNGIILTHTHHDHYDALGESAARYPGVPIYVYKTELPLLADHENVTSVSDKARLQLGTTSLCVMHTPGHTGDSICLYVPAKESASGTPLLITGDTLFVGGCGRTTEALVATLYQSLQTIATLPPETVVFPGHDYGDTPTSTIQTELMHNPFYQAASYEDFYQLRMR